MTDDSEFKALLPAVLKMCGLDSFDLASALHVSLFAASSWVSGDILPRDVTRVSIRAYMKKQLKFRALEQTAAPVLDGRVRIFTCKACGKRRLAEHLDPERVCHICRAKAEIEEMDATS
jgi:hypothetical protein